MKEPLSLTYQSADNSDTQQSPGILEQDVLCYGVTGGMVNNQFDNPQRMREFTVVTVIDVLNIIILQKTAIALMNYFNKQQL